MYKIYRHKKFLSISILASFLLAILTCLVVTTTSSLVKGGVEFLTIGGPNFQVIHSNYLLIQLKDKNIEFVNIHRGNNFVDTQEIKNFNDKGWDLTYSKEFPKSPSYSVLVLDKDKKVINGGWFMRQTLDNNNNADNIISLSTASKQFIEEDEKVITFIGTKPNAKYIQLMADAAYLRITEDIDKSSNKLFYELFCGDFTATGYNHDGEEISNTNFSVLCDNQFSFSATFISNWEILLLSFLSYLTLILVLQTRIVKRKISSIILKNK